FLFQESKQFLVGGQRHLDRLRQTVGNLSLGLVILIQLFSSSVVMVSLGIIGYYIARIHEEIKGRPRYIIAEKCGEEE
ncbi:MAG: hypothetical protein IKC02_04705, partial [Oscillospiraceae bacterium]|nr:hypothetical protein [Oscillospiraceae bacterium]